jgi:hypothetical protein
MGGGGLFPVPRRRLVERNRDGNGDGGGGGGNEACILSRGHSDAVYANASGDGKREGGWETKKKQPECRAF